MTDYKQSLFDYLSNNYLEINQLSEKSCTSPELIKKFIQHACIPKHSHQLTSKTNFQTAIFGETVIEQIEYYYHPCLLEWIETAKNYYAEEGNFEAVAQKIKKKFFDELEQALIEVNEPPYTKNELDHLMNIHWPYVLDGTYGVCLKKISAKNIVIKNLAVAKLEKWISSQNISERNALYFETRQAAELYDNVASSFGPHELKKSTRERLFNKFNDLSKTQ